MATNQETIEVLTSMARERDDAAYAATMNFNGALNSLIARAATIRDCLCCGDSETVDACHDLFMLTQKLMDEANRSAHSIRDAKMFRDLAKTKGCKQD